jgi:hypothetical protein
VKHLIQLLEGTIVGLHPSTRGSNIDVHRGGISLQIQRDAMMNFEKHIDFYQTYWLSSFSQEIAENDWGNKELAENYLKKYWLSDEEYFEKWRPLEQSIFNIGNPPSEKMLKADYRQILIQGGRLFTEEDFLIFQKAIGLTNQTEFVVIQGEQEFTAGEPMFRLKFPIDITWAEVMSGNYISAVVFEMYYNKYYVYGNGVEWGQYTSNDEEIPIHVFGYLPEYSKVGEVITEHRVILRN